MRRLLAAAFIAATLLVVASMPASARYGTVRDGLVDWEWSAVEQPGRYQVTDLVVRPDGWMIVSTGTYADGYLHLIPPWGEYVDEFNRFGSEALGFRQLEIRRGRLFGLRQDPQRQRNRTHNPGVLVELDLQSGAVIRTHGEWWNQDLAVDPVSEDLVLQTSGADREPYRHDLVRYNPDRGSLEVLMLDVEPAADQALEIAYSADGNTLYTANVTDVPPTVDVRNFDGNVRYTLQSGQVDSLVAGRPGTCFEGMLLLTRFDGSVWGLGTAAGSAPTPLAAGGHAGVVSYSTLDREGHLATARFADVTLLACPGFVPPKAPTAPPVVATPPSPEAPVALAGAAPVQGPPSAQAPAAQAPPSPPAAAPPLPPPAPPAPPAPVAPPSAFGGAVQAAGAPSVGAADSPDEEHTTSVAASARTTMAMSLGAVVAMAMVTYAVAVPPSSSEPRLGRVRGSR